MWAILELQPQAVIIWTAYETMFWDDPLQDVPYCFLSFLYLSSSLVLLGPGCLVATTLELSIVEIVQEHQQHQHQH